MRSIPTLSRRLTLRTAVISLTLVTGGAVGCSGSQLPPHRSARALGSSPQQKKT